MYVFIHHERNIRLIITDRRVHRSLRQARFLEVCRGVLQGPARRYTVPPVPPLLSIRCWFGHGSPSSRKR